MSLGHYLRNFSGFAAVGALFYVLAVAFNWIALDLLGLHHFYAPFLIILLLFVLKYYCYLVARIIAPSFWRYTFANIAITLASTYGISFLVDKQGLRGWLASALSLAFFMGVRYAALCLLKVIRKPPPKPATGA